MVKKNFIQLGTFEEETTNFEVLTCPYCRSNIEWDKFYSSVDKFSTLSTDASVTTDEYSCPYCKKAMRVCLDVLIHAEVLDSVLKNPITFTVEGDTVIISGEGRITEDFAKSVKKSNPKNIVIDEGVISIERASFMDFKYLEKIKLPNSLAKIGEYAFFNCSRLKEIIIPNGIKGVEQNTFAFCWSLEKAFLPSSLESIKEGAFRHCIELKELDIPNGVTEIGEFAFEGCDTLTSVNLQGVKHIGRNAFKDCRNLRTTE